MPNTPTHTPSAHTHAHMHTLIHAHAQLPPHALTHTHPTHAHPSMRCTPHSHAHSHAPHICMHMHTHPTHAHPCTCTHTPHSHAHRHAPSCTHPTHMHTQLVGKTTRLIGSKHLRKPNELIRKLPDKDSHGQAQQVQICTTGPGNTLNKHKQQSGGWEDLPELPHHIT